LELKYDEIIDLIGDKNPDRSDTNKHFIERMKSYLSFMKYNKFGRMSKKNYFWILSKIIFVCKKNKQLGLKDYNVVGFYIPINDFKIYDLGDK
jgi:hypothetical protein